MQKYPCSFFWLCNISLYTSIRIFKAVPYGSVFRLFPLFCLYNMKWIILNICHFAHTSVYLQDKCMTQKLARDHVLISFNNDIATLAPEMTLFSQFPCVRLPAKPLAASCLKIARMVLLILCLEWLGAQASTSPQPAMGQSKPVNSVLSQPPTTQVMQ
jgi:hypothetical protein